MHQPYVYRCLNDYNPTHYRNISKQFRIRRQPPLQPIDSPQHQPPVCGTLAPLFDSYVCQHRSLHRRNCSIGNLSSYQKYDNLGSMKQAIRQKCHDSYGIRSDMVEQRQQRWRTFSTDRALNNRDSTASSITDKGPDLPYDVNENADLDAAEGHGRLQRHALHPAVLNGQLAVISFYDSHGDYKKDAHVIQEYMKEGVALSNGEVEENYEVDDTIPSLPIPSVDDTLAMLESSCIPLVENETERSEFRLAARKALMQPMLSFHKRLLRRGDKAIDHNTSWLQLWWNTNCYLNVRTSNVIHSSYFFRFPQPLNLEYNNTNNTSDNFIDDTTKIVDGGQSTIGETSNNRFYSQTTLERATTIIYGALTYAFPILYGKGIPYSAQIKADQDLKTKTPMLCSAQYKYMFGACRIPGPQSDTYRLYQYAPRERSKLPHITVICRGQLYNLMIGDYGPGAPYVLRTPNDGEVDAAATMHMIHNQLIAIVHDARRHSTTTSSISDKNRVPELGWLTTQNRDDWYKDYQWLIKHPEMQDAFHILQSSLLVLCLDDLTGGTTKLGKRESAQDFALRLWHGGRSGLFRDASKHMGGNRFYDKSIQIIMSLSNVKGENLSDTDRSFGVVGEHSMADGMPVAEFSRYLNQCEEHLEMKARPFFDDIDRQKRDNGDIPIQEMSVHNIFHGAYTALSESEQQHLQNRVKEAQYGHIDITNRYELDVVDATFDQVEVEDPAENVITGLGSQFLKLMKLSPDAGIQMVLQLASYRYFGRAVATYESTHTRRFRHGRTETIRSVTGPSLAFCQDLTDALEKQRSPTYPQPSIKNLKPAEQENIMKLFRRACNTHAAYSRKATDGRGCDRHLFGLELLAKRTLHDRIAEEKKALIRSGAPANAALPNELMKALEQRILPTLFNDPVYLRSKHWRLSTSTLPGTAPGFGPVVDDGLGIGYDIRRNHVIYTVTGLRKQNEIGPFGDALKRSVTDVYELLTFAYRIKEHLTTSGER